MPISIPSGRGIDTVDAPATPSSGVWHGVREMARRGWKYYRFFGWSWWLDRRFHRQTVAAIEAEQFRKVQRLVRHAFRNLPFYKEHYTGLSVNPEALNDWDDFRALPSVTKEDLRRNFPDRIVHQVSQIGPADFGRSSGTTGESVQFVRDASWKRNHYYGLLAMHRWRLSPRTGELQTPQCTTTTCSLDRTAVTLEDRVRSWLIRTRLNSYIYLPSSGDIFSEPPEFFDVVTATLKRHRAEYLYGASNYVGQYARSLLERGLTLPLHGVVCSSELLLASVRREIESAFSCPVLNHYACSEIPGVADECRNGRWHVRTDTIYAELEADGRPCGPGELGTLILTDLDNYRMPLIRYDVGDLARQADGACECGRRNHPLIAVEGRGRDAWRDSGMRPVSPAQIGNAVARAGLRGQYRIVQSGPRRVTISTVGFVAAEAPDVVSAVKRELEQLLEDSPQIDWRGVSQIRPEKSHKYRLIYSELTSGPSGAGP
jgi:phenylacetate-CoA ligase